MLNTSITTSNSSKTSDYVLIYNKDNLSEDKQLFQYLPLTPYLEEEFKSQQINILDNFNMAVVEDELTRVTSEIPTFRLSVLILSKQTNL